MNVITNNELKCTVALAALQEVLDPEIGLNVVDLGLISEVKFNEESNTIKVTMTLTTEFCPMGGSIIDSARKVLEAAFGNSEIIILLSFDPPWNYERISEEGKKYLQR